MTVVIPFTIVKKRKEKPKESQKDSLKGLISKLKLTKSEKAVLIFIMERAGKNNKIWYAYPRIAEELAITTVTVKRSIRTLKNLGVVRTEKRFRPNMSQTSNYTILMNPGSWNAQKGQNEA